MCNDTYVETGALEAIFQYFLDSELEIVERAFALSKSAALLEQFVRDAVDCRTCMSTKSFPSLVSLIAPERSWVSGGAFSANSCVLTTAHHHWPSSYLNQKYSTFTSKQRAVIAVYSLYISYLMREVSYQS